MRRLHKTLKINPVPLRSQLFAPFYSGRRHLESAVQLQQGSGEGRKAVDAVKVRIKRKIELSVPAKCRYRLPLDLRGVLYAPDHTLSPIPCRQV